LIVSWSQSSEKLCPLNRGHASFRSSLVLKKSLDCVTQNSFGRLADFLTSCLLIVCNCSKITVKIRNNGGWVPTYLGTYYCK
jgi:hypothetical protein